MSNLVRHIRQKLLQGADPTRATQMARYLKSSQPFYGISAPVVKGTHSIVTLTRQP